MKSELLSNVRGKPRGIRPEEIKLIHGFTRSYLAIIRARAQATARIHAKRETATRLRDGLNQYTIDLPFPRPQAITLKNNYNLHQRKTNIQGTNTLAAAWSTLLGTKKSGEKYNGERRRINA